MSMPLPARVSRGGAVLALLFWGGAFAIAALCFLGAVLQAIASWKSEPAEPDDEEETDDDDEDTGTDDEGADAGKERVRERGGRGQRRRP